MKNPPRMSVKRILSSVSFDLDPERARQNPVIDTLVLQKVPWRKLSEPEVSFAGGGVEKVQVSQLFVGFFFPYLLCKDVRPSEVLFCWRQQLSSAEKTKIYEPLPISLLATDSPGMMLLPQRGLSPERSQSPQTPLSPSEPERQHQEGSK